jgi:hypothetical protein
MSAEPFSYPVLAADIPADGRRFRIEADAQQRSRLAAALQIPAVDELQAELVVRPVLGGAYAVRGILRASVVQTDVVSLEPVAQELVEDIDVTLMRAEDAGPSHRGKIEPIDAAELEGPDLFHHGRIDLGAIMREHLALGLDPYPRAPGSEFPGHIEDDTGSDPSPFAVLGALKGRGE